MKFFTILLIMMTSASYSFTLEKEEFYITAGMGYNLPSKKKPQNAETGSRFAYSLGVFTEIPFSELVSVSTGFNIVNEGFNFVREQKTQYYDYSRNLESNYNIFNIHLPLKVSFNYFNSEKIKAFFSGGVYYNYLINKNINKNNIISLYSNKAIESINYSISSPVELENYFFGLLFSAGAQFSNVKTEVFFRSSWDPFYYFLNQPADNVISVSFIGLNVAYKVTI